MKSRENLQDEEVNTVLPVSFYKQDTVRAAQGLLGCFLDHRGGTGRVTGRIVETEAYVSGDEAAHSFRGKTKRNSVLFGPVGHAYVYFIYGMHCCLNAVTGREGSGEAVLIRALEPVGGIGIMQQRRETMDLRNLCSGPGKLTKACGITLACNGISLTESPLRILSPASIPGFVPVGESEIVRTTRIGITKSADFPLRFMIKGKRFVSRRAALLER
jgi:DNA-3-methyladenine glycosylase